MNFETFKHGLEVENSIPQISEEQEWIAKDTWDYQEGRIEALREGFLSELGKNRRISIENKKLKKDNEGMKKILKMYKEQCDYYGDSLAGSWWDVYNEAEPYIKEEKCTAQS